MADTPKLEMPELAPSQASPSVTHNEALRRLDGLVQATIIDRDLADAPSGPADGDTYIVASGTSSGDDWDVSGIAADDIVYYKSDEWISMTPAEGWLVYVQDEDIYLKFSASSFGWEPLQSVDIASFYIGEPTVGQTILRIPLTHDVDFADDFLGSYGTAGTAATASAECSIQQDDGSSGAPFEVGTMTFPASPGTDATFATPSAAAPSFAKGDILIVVAPNPKDTTLADIGFMLAGTRGGR